MMPNMQHARKGDGLMRNVSSTHEEKYQTWDGNVTVTNLKRGLWSVHPRGYAPFMVGSKREAFDQAVGLSVKAKERASAARTTRLTHATKRAVPGVSKWSMNAGGTGAAEGKHGYTFTVPEGTYRIWPYTTQFGRHAGYALKFSAEGGRPRGSHGGLWHDLGSHRSPQKAASVAAAHYAKGFE